MFIAVGGRDSKVVIYEIDNGGSIASKNREFPYFYHVWFTPCLILSGHRQLFCLALKGLEQERGLYVNLAQRFRMVGALFPLPQTYSLHIY
jgi:hypothetical protein